MFLAIFLIFSHFVLIVKSQVQCEKLIGYYVGEFGGVSDHYPNGFFSSQFEFQLEAKNEDQKIHLRTINYNTTYVPGVDTFLHILGTGGNQMCNDNNADCSVSFNNGADDAYFQLHIHNRSGNYWSIIYFEHFKNIFQLNDPVGRCTKNQNGDGYGTDMSHYQYCVCCDFYYPEDALNCPENPWFIKTSTSTPTTSTVTSTPTTTTVTTTQTTTSGSTKTTQSTKISTSTVATDKFGIDCNQPVTTLDVIYCNKTWGTPNDVNPVVTQTKTALDPEKATKKEVYEVSYIFDRISKINGIHTNDYSDIFGLYDHVLNIDENTFWAANDQEADSTYRLLNGLENLMYGTKTSHSLLDGKNFGLQRKESVECDAKKYAGLADYGNNFGPNDKKNYVASIEIPMDVLCGGDKNPIYYAIYRRTSLFVPNSTTEGSKQDHLISGFQLAKDTSSDKKFDPEKEKPKTDRCAIGFYQNHNIILTATILNKTLAKKVSQSQSRTMSIIKYKKSKVKESLHGKFKVSWWDGSKWASDKTCTVTNNGDYHEAKCNHLTDFTLLVDGAQTDPILCDKALSIFGYTTNSGSIVSLIVLNTFYAFNFFTPLRNLIVGLFISQPLLRFKVDAVTGIYNILLMLFFIFFTILNDQNRTGGNTGCQVIAAIEYWLLLCCIFLTLFQAWRILKIFAFNSRMEQVIIFITKPLVIVIASLTIPALICIIAFVSTHDFYNRNDNFCWIKPTYVTLAVVLPLTIMILNGFICLFIILLRMYPNARVFKPLSRLASVQSNLISQAQKNQAREKIITVLIMQFTLGIPWAIQYLTLFSPRATAWHYIFTFIIGTQGIVLLLLFLYKRYQAYQRQQVSTTSGVSTGITNARSVQEPKSESHYDSVAYDYERPRRAESVVHRARQFVINKLSSDKSRRVPNRPPPPPPIETETMPVNRGLRRAE